MAERCERDQWHVDDLDWSVPPRPMSREQEEAVVQYFTDMAGIEMLAGELFRAQQQRVQDPLLKKIFASFVVDEERHAAIGARLAQHYDVHRYRTYVENPHLTAFRPHFVAAIRAVSAEVANAYITGGELLLDVALLRSLNDYVDDDMSHQAMHLINRDESRHIAMDFYMVEMYASPEGQRILAAEKRGVRDAAHAAWRLGNLLWHAAPFFQDVFFEPLARVDPSGSRMKQAFKRLQLLGRRDHVCERPFWRFVASGRWLYENRVTGPLIGGVAQRVAGLPDDLMKNLYDEQELQRALGMSLEDLTEETVGLKYAS